MTKEEFSLFKSLKEQFTDEVIEAYEMGMNPEDIAEEFGYDEIKVMEICDEYLKGKK